MRSAVIGFRFFFASFIVPNNATRPAALVHAPLRGGALLTFTRLVDLVGALARPLAPVRVAGAPDVRRAALAPATGR